MTDLEMTKACAEAMNIPYKLGRVGSVSFVQIVNYPTDENGGEYCPLYDDTQAMALVKKLGINVWWNGSSWRTLISRRDEHTVLHEYDVWNDDLNRAIVECVAKLTIQSTAPLSKLTQR